MLLLHWLIKKFSILSFCLLKHEMTGKLMTFLQIIITSLISHAEPEMKKKNINNMRQLKGRLFSRIYTFLS